MTKPTMATMSRPTRISISYAGLVALVTQGVLFVQDILAHTWGPRDTLFLIAVAVGLITLVGPFLPVPVSFDTQPPATDAPDATAPVPHIALD